MEARIADGPRGDALLGPCGVGAMRFLQWIWWELLAIPVRLILRVVPDLELSEESIFFHLAKVAVLLVALYVFSSIAGRVKRRYRRIRRKDSLIEPEEAVALRVKRMQTPPSQEPSPSPPLGKGPPNHTDENTLRGQTYVSMSKFKEAARSFKKAGDHRRAATCLAQAGRPLKAAKLLMQEGDFVTAGRYYTEAGKTGLAAKAYERSGDLAAAAAAYARGNRFDEAIAMYNEYFADPTDPVAEQGAVAEACYKMLEEGAKKGKVRQEARQELLRPLAERFEHTNQYGLAGRLYREMGSFAHAGEVFVLAGKLEDAADCMRKAGREHEASRLSLIHI